MGLFLSCGKAAEQHDLFSAIREGDIQQLKSLLNVKPKLVVTALSYHRLSPLHYAALHGQPEVLSVLLERGAQVNAINHHKQTSLMLACKNGRLSCVERLLEWSTDILMFDCINGRTCLHYAAKSGHLNCLQKILDAGRQPPVADTWGFARFVNVRDDNGATPLHLAARSCHFTVVRSLLDNGALVSATTTGARRSNRSGSGNTPLHYAARGGSTECVKELLASGADRNQRDSKGHTAYYVAIKYNNTACAVLLNPDTASPLVWPSPWKFISDLDPEAKKLLEEALVVANNAWEKKVRGEIEADLSACEMTRDASTTAGEQDNEESEMCCICFENTCTIQVQDCAHQMCAGCTLALCCHNRPNPTMPNTPPPACPFCRCNIRQLKLACPKEMQEVEIDKSLETSSIIILKKVGEESSSSLKGLVGKGSFRLLSSKGFGKVADLESVKECSSQEICTPVTV